MTFEGAREVALKLLREKGYLLNTHLLRVVGRDELLMREVRESLIFDDLAVDKNGVGLLASTHLSAQSRPDPRVSTTTEPPRPVPASAGDQQSVAKVAERRDPERTEFAARHSSSSSELKSLWALAGNGNRQQPAPASADKPTLHQSAESISAPKPRPGTDDSSIHQQRYFFWNGGHESGPYPRQELEKLAAEGHLKPLDFVKVEGADEWIPVSEALKRTGKSEGRRWSLIEASPIVESDGTAENCSSSASEKKTESFSVPSNISAINETTVDIEQPVASTQSEATSATASIRPLTTTTNRTRTPSRVFAEVQSSPLVAWWKKGEERLGAKRVRRGLALSLLVAAVCIYWNWPPASDSIYESFMRIRVEMDGLQDKQSSPAEWKRFTSAHRPHLEQLVATLRNRASAARPADQELLWAGERCLLPILQADVGGTGRLNQLFSTHMRNARRILDGEPPVEIAAASATNSTETSSQAIYSALPAGVQPAVKQVSGISLGVPGEKPKQEVPPGK